MKNRILIAILISLFFNSCDEELKNSRKNNYTTNKKDCEAYFISLFESGKCKLEEQGYTNVESTFCIFGCGSNYKNTGFEAISPNGKKVKGYFCRKRSSFHTPTYVYFR